MRITKLQLINFRNYTNDVMEPDPGMSVLVGPNAHGKSALLEAGYVLATSKSHRTTRDSDLIRIGADCARVYGEVEREKREDTVLEIRLARKEKKVVRINQVRHERVGHIVGQLNVVIFSTADLDMVKGDPSHRRRFLNLEISQVSPQYVYALGRYKRVLEQRNRMLKESQHRGSSNQGLGVWDNQLVHYGSIMIEKRVDFLKRLSEIAGPTYDRLVGGVESLEMHYEPSVVLEGGARVEEIRESFGLEVRANRDQDVARGTTTRGPHRDDIGFRVDGMDLRSYGSQGQQRSVALAVKLAEIGLVEEAVGESPVALLDDVAAELDEERRKQVFELTLGRCQTVVTATSLGDLPREVLAQSTVFTVTSGTVRRS